MPVRVRAACVLVLADRNRLKRIAEISAEMAELQRQKKDAFRMKLRREVDLQTFRAVTKEIDTALDQR